MELTTRETAPLSIRWPEGCLFAFLLTGCCAGGCDESLRAPAGPQSSGARPGVDYQVPEPGDACQIAVTGTDKRWHVRYAGRDGQMATADDVTAVGVVHVPVDARVTLILGSTDYVYTLALPQFGLKEIAVPTLEFRLHFQPDAVGEFELRGDQLCGEPHPDLLGRLFVEPREQFAAWLYAQSPRQAAE